MENFYEINQGTLCLLKKDENTTEIYELRNNYIIKKNINKISLIFIYQTSNPNYMRI